MGRIRRLIKENEEFLRRHRKMIIFILAVTAIVILFFGTKLYLMVQFLLGHDIVVKLGTSDEHVTLARGQNASVTFTTSVVTNPFCTATCDAEFSSLSADALLANESFSLRPGSPYERTYTLRAAREGHGLELYQYRMECRSVRTALCQTSEQPTARNVLVTMSYDLNAEDLARKEAVRGTLVRASGRLGELFGILHALPAVLLSERPDLATDERILRSELNGLHALWLQERYAALESRAEEFKSIVAAFDADVTAFDADARERIVRYNELIDIMNDTRDVLLTLPPTTDPTLAARADALVGTYTLLAAEPQDAAIVALANDTVALFEDVVASRARASVAIAMRTDIVADALCAYGECVPHPNLTQRVQEMPSLESACDAMETLRTYLVGTADANATLAARASVQAITNAYLAALPEGPNAAAIRETLVAANVTPVAFDGNASAIAAALNGELPPSCALTGRSLAPEPLLLEPLVAAAPSPETLPAFEEPLPICCLHDTCGACVDNPDDAYPIVFLHGHAFNKDTLADYSLDAFNRIQQRFEDDGYVNAGTVSPYTTLDSPRGELGMIPAPVTVKGSYYFDVFKEPDNYVVVQTKSESIDTYAIRLKDIIGTVQHETGKRKVVIVAHSMGGLVARRYMDLFGAENVALLVMIGTPNHGITGNEAQYCSLIGASLECRDLRSDSLFLNKLNRDPLPGIPVVNIVGRGCTMRDGDGDGVVLVENAILDGAKNVYIDGSCTGIETLHTGLLDVRQYPAVYDAVKDAVNAS